MFDELEIKGLLEAQGTAFKTFAARYDAALEEERAEREALELRLSRGGLEGGGGGGGKSATAAIERKALAAYAKTGSEAELKAMSVGSDPDGGYVVTAAMAAAIRNKLRDQSPIAALARRVTVTTGDAWAEPFERGDTGATWVGEPQARPATDSPNLGLFTVPLREVYALVPVTQKLLDTGPETLGAWLEGRIAEKFARTEGAAYVSGDGVARPRGFLSHSTAATGDSTRTEGVLQYVPSGASGAFLAAASYPGDSIINLVYSLRAPYRPGAVFLMNSLTAGAVRKLKDVDGRYLWSDSLTAGQPPLLAGYPVMTAEDMPDIAADSYSIAFGNFEAGYTIAEAPGVRFMRDPYSDKPNVGFYAYRRVGGGVADFDAIKLMKFAAS